MSDNKNSDFSKDVHLWAYINFRLQAILCQNTPHPSEAIKRDLHKVGYEGIYFYELSDIQKRELLKRDAFFGSFQTGHRIVTFALKRSGLDKDMLNNIHESINSAYEAIVDEHGKGELLEASYRHTLQTLSVFRP